MTKALWATTIFLSAFLVFQIQPLIARLLLPWFGGAAAVWTTCLVFFQVVLLLGYGYAHGLNKLIPSRFQPVVHLVLIGLSVLVSPIRLRADLPISDPSLCVLAALTLSVGLPYFVLSTTSPLLQAWYPRDSGEDVYRFYALSNAGSLLAVLSYPVLFEPLFKLRSQTALWSIAYVVACGGSAAATLRRGREPAKETVAPAASSPGRGTIALWIALPACSSALLLTITNHLSQNLAAIPLLWVIPLALYLLSFILAFSSRNFYPRYLYLRLLAVALAAIAYALDPRFGTLSLVVLIPLYCAALFICCMVCHGELARLKPAPQHLTAFYFVMSLGGALGGMFVALAAPHFFRGFYEFPSALAACAVLALIVLYRDPESPFYQARWNPAWLIVLALAAIIIGSFAAVAYRQRTESRVMVRNFYGALRELEKNNSSASRFQTGTRALLNGSIQHGMQSLTDDLRREPTTYYGRRSGVGLALMVSGRSRPLRVGVIGLGIGTVAAYGRAGDQYIFYELNPQVIELARRDFTYLGDSAANIQVFEGDGRLTLERQSPQNFDVLIADAFSGDAIPVHLLTRQAFELYFRHLKPDGVLAVHISNNYLNLQPIVTGAASVLGKQAVRVRSEDSGWDGTLASTWILVSDNHEFLYTIAIREAGAPALPDPGFQPWTDDSASVFRILKWIPG